MARHLFNRHACVLCKAYDHLQLLHYMQLHNGLKHPKLQNCSLSTSTLLRCPTVKVTTAPMSCHCIATQGDDYNHIMVEALADRLAEAFAEKLHEIVRKDLWGYAPNEDFSTEDLLKVKYQGQPTKILHDCKRMDYKASCAKQSCHDMTVPRALPKSC